MILNGIKIADRGYYINLPSSTERKQNVESQIQRFNIENLERFEALTDTRIHSSATKSHRKIFELASELGLESVVVLEDDFQLYDEVYVRDYPLRKSFLEYLKEVKEDMDNQEWDVILLGFNGKKTCIPMSRHFSIPFKSTGAWAYIIKKRAYEFILNTYDYGRDVLAIDDILPILNWEGFRTVATNVQLFHHGVGFISTLNPQGPVDYRQWIDGNYYNTIWKHVEVPEPTFDECLDKIYENSRFNREYLVVIKNYPTNYIEIEEFIKSKNEYKNSLVLLDESTIPFDNFRALNYHFGVESFLLVNWLNQKEKITKYYKNILTIESI